MAARSTQRIWPRGALKGYGREEHSKDMAARSTCLVFAVLYLHCHVPRMYTQPRVYRGQNTTKIKENKSRRSAHLHEIRTIGIQLLKCTLVLGQPKEVVLFLRVAGRASRESRYVAHVTSHMGFMRVGGVHRHADMACVHRHADMACVHRHADMACVHRHADMACAHRHADMAFRLLHACWHRKTLGNVQEPHFARHMKGRV